MIARADKKKKTERRVVTSAPPGRAIDVGTTKLISACWTAANEMRFRRERNAFLDLKKCDYTRKMLEHLDVKYSEPNGRIYVAGDAAFEIANVLERNTRRPMSRGVVSATEHDAIAVLKSLIERLVPPARVEDELCVYSVPADPIDADIDGVYHSGVIEQIVKGMGFRPYPIHEGLAVVFSEMENEGYTGIGVSCGGGMFNVCVAYRGVEAVSFSTARGGDWIDEHAAKALGLPAPEVCAAKESGFDLRHANGRVEEALAIYTRNLIRYTLDGLARRFEERDVLPAFGRPVALSLAGGAVLAPGFLDLFREEFGRRSMPFDVAEIRGAPEPLHAVARGGLKLTKLLTDGGV